MVASEEADQRFCPTFRPTKEEFCRPFCDYVQDVCKQHPDIPLFKVVPPRGWNPRRSKFPKLEELRINTPIKQHVRPAPGLTLMNSAVPMFTPCAGLRDERIL